MHHISFKFENKQKTILIIQVCYMENEATDIIYTQKLSKIYITNRCSRDLQI